METDAAAGRYPLLVVERPWSADNPRLEGEFASPWAIRWYLGAGTDGLPGRGRP